jgi:hypothetical protein
MLKKNLWVAGLLAALAIMFIGCVEALPPPEGEEVEVWNLQTILADKPDGVIEDWGSVFGDTPFQKCGNPQFTIITDGGVKKLQIDKMVNGWGEGLDLYNLDKPADKVIGIDAMPGDIIYVKGTINPTGNGLKLANGGGKAKFGGWASDASFDRKYPLSAGDVGDIRGASPQAIRISYDAPDGDARKGTIIIEQITFTKVIKGAQPVFSSDFVFTNFVYEKNWVNGVTFTAKKGKTTGDVTVYYRTPAVLDVGGNVTTPAGAWSTTIPQAAGTYDVQFDVAEVKDKFQAATGLFSGSKDDGTPIYYQMFVFDKLPAGSKEVELAADSWTGFVSIGTANATTGTFVTGPANRKLVFLTGNNLTVPDEGMPPALATAGFTAGKTVGTAADADFPYPRVIYHFENSSNGDTNWKAYKEIKFTYDLWSLSNSDAQLQVNIRGNNSATGYGNGGDLPVNEELGHNGSGNTYAFEAGVGNTISFAVKDLVATSATTSGISFQKNTDNTAFLIKFTKIEYVAY